ncbi:hypothetical protein JTE90_003795 [Oedothorax gibbosus]|uniref:Uncharacterized protein n=1 Tax=Oedothorax gibbosus TaxID=931172 RepID=A0AAV6VBJ2_9ARAC|nr:hypothetical protein JTE90_003795 [Oedothorax gibbosus]
MEPSKRLGKQELKLAMSMVPNIVLPPDIEHLNDSIMPNRNDKTPSESRFLQNTDEDIARVKQTPIVVLAQHMTTLGDSGHGKTQLHHDNSCLTKTADHKLTRTIPLPKVILPQEIETLDNSPRVERKTSRDSCGLPKPDQDSPRILQIPDVVLLPDKELPRDPTSSGLNRNGKTHSSFRLPKQPAPKQTHLCRHHSDSEAKDRKVDILPKRRIRGKRVRRSVSAIETNKQSNYRPKVRRSFSDRSGLIMAGKHLAPPAPSSSRSSRLYDSSRCSSIKTMSSNVSLSEIVAVEMGLKDIPGLTIKEARRRRVVLTVMLVFSILLVLSVALVAVTLLLSPAVDELSLREERVEQSNRNKPPHFPGRMGRLPFRRSPMGFGSGPVTSHPCHFTQAQIDKNLPSARGST